MIASDNQVDIGMRSIPITMKDPDMKMINIGKSNTIRKMTTHTRIDTTMGTHLSTTIGNLRTTGVMVTPTQKLWGKPTTSILNRQTKILTMIDKGHQIPTDKIIDESLIMHSNISNISTKLDPETIVLSIKAFRSLKKEMRFTSQCVNIL